MSARRVLVLFFHPALERSRVNRGLFEAVRGLPDVTARDLYEEYPSFAIDASTEQAALAEHDVIVFQHPFYWYSGPSLLKEWLDVVLEHGWAYGTGGEALRGKLVLHVITTGGNAPSYAAGGGNRFSMRELLAPYDQTAHLCGMKFLAPLAVHGALRVSGEEIEPLAARYTRALEMLRDGTIDVERAMKAGDLAEVLDASTTEVAQ